MKSVFYSLLFCCAATQRSHAALDCTLSPPIRLDTNLFLQQIANYEAGTYTMRLTYTGGYAWVGIGINTSGRNRMTPANAVIGRVHNDGSTSVLDYSMFTDAQDGSGVQPRSSQLLTDTSFVQSNGQSQLTFTQSLDGVSDSSVWIFGVGLADNQWEGKHRIAGSFSFSLTSCVEIPDTPSPTVATASPTSTPTPFPTRSPVIFEPTVSPQPTISLAPSPGPTISPLPSEAPTSTPTSGPTKKEITNIFGDGTENNSSSSSSSANNANSGNSQFQVFDNTHPYRTLWALHGVLLFLAWGICAPIGIGASILRNIFPRFLGESQKGLWYTLHFYGNVLTTILTVIGFFIAVIATAKEEGATHFDDVHHKVGLAIFILVIIQAVAGHFRPPATAATKTTTDDDEATAAIKHHNVKILASPSGENDDGISTVEVGVSTGMGGGGDSVSSSSLGGGDDRRKGSPGIGNQTNNNNNTASEKPFIRLLWEYGHRLLGMILLALAWFNCHTGIEWHVSNYDDQNDYTGAFWGVTGGISGLVFFLAYVVRM